MLSSCIRLGEQTWYDQRFDMNLMQTVSLSLVWYGTLKPCLQETAKLARGQREGKGSQANDPPPSFGAFVDSGAHDRSRSESKSAKQLSQTKKSNQPPTSNRQDAQRSSTEQAHEETAEAHPPQRQHIEIGKAHV